MYHPLTTNMRKIQMSINIRRSFRHPYDRLQKFTSSSVRMGAKQNGLAPNFRIGIEP